MSAYSSLILSEAGLVSYWRMDAASGTAETDRKGTSTGTYSGGFTLNQTGLIAGDPDTAVSFNGTTGQVACGTVNLGTGAISLEAWVNVAAFQATSPWISSICGMDLNSGNSAMLRFGDGSAQANNAKPQFAVSIAGGYHIVTGASLNTGTIYHVVGVWDTSNLSLYVNAGLVAQASTAGATSANTAFGIAYSPVNGRFFNGTIDEVAAYNAALSPVQVSTHYASGAAAGITPRLKAGDGVRQPDVESVF